MPRTGRPRIFADTTMVSVRLDNDLTAELEDIAEELCVSRSDLLRAMIQYCVDSVRTGNLKLTSYVPE